MTEKQLRLAEAKEGECLLQLEGAWSVIQTWKDRQSADPRASRLEPEASTQPGSSLSYF